jgi:glycosyltransferase involved in cell wall biosynthesis
VNRRRLCFVVESGTDVRLVEGLAEHFQLTIVARRIEGGVEISQRPSPSIPVTTGPSGRTAFARLVLAHLRRRHRDIDYVIVQGYGPAAFAANLAGRLTSTRTVMLVCSPVERYYRCRTTHSKARKKFRSWEYLGLCTTARLNAIIGQRYIVLSDHLKEVVSGHGAHRPIDVIPVYGVDTTIFAPSNAPKRDIRKQLGLPTTGALVFFGSRIAPEKDAETLLAAIQHLLQGGRDVWILHRSGGYREFLETAAQFEIDERVIATDAVHPHQELPLNYQASDVCVQASREEGLGFAPLEALAAGVPVVAAHIGGLRETIVDGVTGWTYPVGDVRALVTAIETVLDNPQEAVRRAAAGREMVVAKYDRSDVLDELHRVMVEPWT